MSRIIWHAPSVVKKDEKTGRRIVTLCGIRQWYNRFNELINQFTYVASPDRADVGGDKVTCSKCLRKLEAQKAVETALKSLLPGDENGSDTN